MRYAARLLGLAAVTAVLVPIAETPGFSKELWGLLSPDKITLPSPKTAEVAAPLSEGKEADGAAVLLQVEGVLEEGDGVLDDDSLYDAYTFEGQTGQTVAITLESIEFDTFLLLRDGEGNELARNNDIDTEVGNYHSFIVLTLPANGTYQIWANGHDDTSRGRYRLTMVKSTPEQAAPLLSAAALRQVEANRLLQQGLQQFDVSQFREALQSWNQAVEIYRDIQSRHGEGLALGNLGEAYRNLGDYRQSIDFQEQSLAIAREVGDRSSEGNALINLGNAYLSLGDYRQAITFYEQGLMVAQEIGNRSGEGLALGNLGEAYRNLGDYRQSIDFQEQSLAIAREAGDRSSEGNALINLGNAYLSLGDYRQAITFYEQGLMVAQEIGNRSGEGLALGNLGEAYRNLGEYQQAIVFYEQSLAIAQKINNRGGEGLALGGLGNAYNNLGEYRHAITFYSQSLAISREISDRSSEGIVLGSLGVAHWSLGNYQQAIAFQEQSLTIAREIGDRSSEGRALGNLGAVNWSLGNYHQAINFVEQQLVITRETGARAEEGLALGNLGSGYESLGDYQQAINLYQQALIVLYETGNRYEIGGFLGYMGQLLAKIGEPELAIVFLKASVDVHESIRGDIRDLDPSLQQSFTDSVADTYRNLADLLLRQNRILEAQRVLDLLKVQELDDSLRGVRSTSGTASGVAFWQVESDLLALYEQVIADSDELAQLQAADYDSLSLEQQQRLTTLRQRYGDVQSRFTAFLDLTEVKELLDSIREETDGQNLDIERQHRALQNNLRGLPQKTALLYPLILSDRLELVLVTADGPPLRYPINVKGEDLNRAIVAFGQALKDPSSDIQPLAQQLYTWLVAPLEPQLEQAGIESLLYAPDGALRYVPLAALHDGKQYLAQRFSLSHITAASLTNFDQVPNAEGRRLLAAACAECSFTVNVGGATFPFSDLPFTETEVKALAEQVPNTSVLLNQGFSRRELENRLGSYSIIHLATHGAVVENQPSQSFVVLGSGEHVTLEAIRESWSLSHAELVVLSACETAVGSPQLGSGVEILGLGYQIQEAGALGVLASLWKVSDQGTQVLMSAFYDALAQGMTKTEALQAAQNALVTGDFSVVGGDRATIELISTATGQPLVAGGSLAHPYYWAPFILIGNGL